jgi:hypothetical protein
MRPRSYLRPLTVVLCGIVAIGGSAHRASATVLVPVDLTELVAGARAVVHGHVVSTTAQWREGRRGIETLVTLATEDALKGGASETVTFRVPGGQMGPYRSFMPGAPVFSEGDDVIVFLGGDGPEVPHLVGFSQGVYRVLAGTGLRMVRPGVPSAAGGEVRLARGAPGRSSVPLESFEAQVKALVTSGSGR